MRPLRARASPDSLAVQGPRFRYHAGSSGISMGVQRLPAVPLLASLSALAMWFVLAVPTLHASPTPDPAPAGLTPTPDAVGQSAAPPRQTNRASVSQSSTTPRESSGSTTRSSSTRTQTRTSQSTSTNKAAATKKTTPRKPAVTRAAEPVLAPPILQPAAARATGQTDEERNGDLPLSAAIALGVLVLASLSLVGLGRRIDAAAE